MATKQINAYNTADQGGQQWGRLTQQDLYYWSNGQWNFQQQQRLRYRTRADSSGNYWLIVPYLQGVYETGGTARQLSLLYYDGATNNPETQTLNKGALTLSRSVLINSPIPGTSNHWYTSDTRFVYDPTGFGNQTQIKTNPAYGEVGWSGSAWNYSVLPSSSTEQITSISYESAYNLYPISVKQEGAAGTSDDLTTSFQIYGFNGVALDGWQEQTGLLKQVTNPNGTIVIYEYDPFGRLVATYENSTDRGTVGQYLDGDPLTRYRYWDNGWNQSIMQGGQPVPVDYLNPENDDPFMITTQTRPGSYNPSTPGYEFRTQTFFDGLGRVIQEQNTYQEVHDPDAGTLLQKDVVTTTRYNGLGLTDCQTTPYAVDLYNQRATFPANPYVPGNCTSYSRTTTTYDNLGRPLTITSPGGAVSTYAYGLATGITVNGHNRFAITRIQDANNHLVRHYSNVFGQLALVREYKGVYPNETDYADTRYEYDILGNLVRVGTSTPSASQPTSWFRFSRMSYDAFGRKLNMTDPDMGYWAYTYDALGNLLTQDANPGTPADRKVLCFTYDSFNRLTHKRQDNPVNGCSSGDTLLANTSYYIAGSGGATGQVQEVKWPDSSNRETFSYDNLGRLFSHSRWIGSNIYITGYGSFDKLNRPQTITYPNSESVTMTYDHEGDKSLSAGGTPLVSDIWYNKRGQMTEVFRGNNVRTTYDYADATGDFRLENAYTRRFVYPFTTNLLDFDYTYDDVGNIDHVFEDVSNDSQWFAYDELNRLTDAYTSGGPASYDHDYTYDELGNLQSRTETVGGTPTTYDLLYPTGNNPTRPDAVTSVKVGTQTVGSFSYDSHGNMTSRMENGVTYSQTFDGENRLITVTLSGGAPITTTFRYDAGGQRTQTLSYTDSTHRTVTDYPFPHYEVERVQQWEFCEGCAEGGVWLWVTTQTTTRSTYFLAGQAMATRVNGTLYHLHSDHPSALLRTSLGSTSLMTNSSGYSVSGTTARYLPYGGGRTTPTANLTELGYTGHHDSPEVKLIYMNARWYDSQIGRFISADTIVPNPINPQSFSRYSYVLNNPIRYVDPTGHCGADSASEVGAEEQEALTQECISLRNNLQEQYGINIIGSWKLYEMEVLANVLSAYADAIGLERFTEILREAVQAHDPAGVNSTLTISRARRDPDVAGGEAAAGWLDGLGTIEITNGVFDEATLLNYYSWPQLRNNPDTIRDWIIGHEIGHVLLDGIRTEHGKGYWYYEDLYSQKVPSSDWFHPLHSNESLASEIANWAVLKIDRPGTVDTFINTFIIPGLNGTPVTNVERGR